MTTPNCMALIGCPGGGVAAQLEEPRTETYELPDLDEKKIDSPPAANSPPPKPASPPKPSPPKKTSKDNKNKNNNKKNAEVNHLPILIIPGFMSSGLEIKASQSRPDWVGKRIWLNLGSLGLSSLYFGPAQNDKKKQQEKSEEEEQQQYKYKSHWLEHMRLLPSDLCSDPPGGIQVRAIPGLEGVDYLTPGTFTNMVSYVFGPVIAALVKAGYQPGINLQAAPYDWRLPPAQLERRDKYFTRVAQQVEELYHNNHGTPVVLLGHSLGTKTAHYFLNFALQHKGQDWIDRHIHTYLPVGAPHLGAPKALRSVVAGDKMSLDAFLNDEEALALGRSFGSGPWLFPKNLPPGAPSSVYVLPHGVLEMSFVSSVHTRDLVYRRTAASKPNRYQIIVSYGNDVSRTVNTPFTSIHQGDKVSFSDKISFATHPNAKDAAAYGQLRFFLQEPGIAAAKEEVQEKSFCYYLWTPICCLLRWITCCCICDYAYRLVRWVLCGVLVRGVALSADAITSGAGGGANLAFSTPMEIPREVWSGKTVTRKVQLLHKDDYDAYERILCFSFGKDPRMAEVQVQFRWIPYDNERSTRSKCSPVCEPDPEKCKDLVLIRNKTEEYQDFSGHDILEREGLDNTLGLIQKVYDGDSLGPRTSSSIDAPPVQRIHAIYGINVTTEVAGVYRRKDRCLSDNALKNMYKLDANADISAKSSGYSVRGGLVYETKKTKQSVADGRQVCGDGTVPYWSLQHCKTWKTAGKDVSVVELENAEHREILADARFHKAILEYCRIKKEPV